MTVVYECDPCGDKSASEALDSFVRTPGGGRVRAIYLPVPTRVDKRDDDDARRRKRQEIDNQRRQLLDFCNTQGWQIVAEYIGPSTLTKNQAQSP